MDAEVDSRRGYFGLFMGKIWGEKDGEIALLTHIFMLERSGERKAERSGLLEGFEFLVIACME